ncbi:MAG: type IX secretion system plug protein domain-containing protein, partial [Bacteroidota bacterium]
MRIRIKQIIWFFLVCSVSAQVQEEINPPTNIKTIIFKGPTEDQFPVIKLGEPMTLEFDDLTANEQDYYYKIIH